MTAEKDAYAYLMITGSGSCDPITQQLGREPDDSWSEGDPRRIGQGAYNFAKWTLHSGEKKGLPLDVHLRSLWSRIEPFENRLRDLAPEFSRYLVCVAWFPDRDARVTISAGHFRTAAYYRLELDFDFYFSDESDNEDAGEG